jgi:hypothetical protein
MGTGNAPAESLEVGLGFMGFARSSGEVPLNMALKKVDCDDK